MKDYYYYFRDSEKKPVVTVCLLKDINNDISRGIAICSKKDSPCKKAGRKIAKERAEYAMRTGSWNGSVLRKDALKIVKSFKLESFFYKSFYKPNLTTYERNILGMEDATI